MNKPEKTVNPPTHPLLTREVINKSSRGEYCWEMLSLIRVIEAIAEKVIFTRYNDGDEWSRFTGSRKSSKPDVEEVFNALTGVDESTLEFIDLDTDKKHRLFFVFGNSPGEIINDTSGLPEDLDKPITAATEKAQEEMEAAGTGWHPKPMISWIEDYDVVTVWRHEDDDETPKIVTGYRLGEKATWATVELGWGRDEITKSEFILTDIHGRRYLVTGYNMEKFE